MSDFNMPFFKEMGEVMLSVVLLAICQSFSKNFARLFPNRSRLTAAVTHQNITVCIQSAIHQICNSSLTCFHTYAAKLFISCQGIRDALVLCTATWCACACAGTRTGENEDPPPCPPPSNPYFMSIVYDHHKDFILRVWLSQVMVRPFSI